MKLAIISDIHANLSALKAVLNVIDSESVDRLICLGDIVGYGARPDECVDVICKREIACVLGNHDAAAVGRHSCTNFHPKAQIAINWNADKLSDNSKEYLLSLDYTLTLNGYLFAHSSPRSPARWNYLRTNSDANDAFLAFEQSISFIGHTHIPQLFETADSERKLINVGSVGQPRDGDSRACFLLYDTETDLFQWKRVEYNIEEAAQQILDAGLPSLFAERLYKGK